jgi:predicted nucleic acid-binding protein
MKCVFADANYWVALGNRKDQWHQAALQASQELGQVVLVTSDEILDEFLAYFSSYGPETRAQSAETVRALLAARAIEVVPQSRQTFLAGLGLYEARPDKSYSLTDCIAMAIMRERGIAEILTHDAHFTQEGFTVLL